MANIKHIVTIINEIGEQVEFSGARELQLRKARKYIKEKGGNWRIKIEAYKGSQKIDYRILPR